MDTSRTLINAQINFIDDTLRLIHIPLSSYRDHLQAVLQLLLEENDDGENANKLWSSRHPFFNISFNSVECSILCSSALAEKYFGNYPSATNRSNGTSSTSPTPAHATPSMSKDDFVAISVEGEGLEAGQRVLDLTTPLAMASIPIFFITTYFCDYILVPLASRPQVVGALEERGFVFEANPDHLYSDNHVNVAAHHRNRSSVSSATLARTGSQNSVNSASSPTTPPPASVAELQTRTFNMLQKRNISLKVLSEIRLIQCAGRRQPVLLSGNHASGPNAQDLALQMGLVKCLAHPPNFLSATLTATDPPAILLEDATRQEFFNSGALSGGDGEVLLGAATSHLVPIMLNLEALPLEATGIVCGVAGRMAEATQSGVGAIEMSFLSTARTGTVLVEENDLEEAMRALGLEIEVSGQGEGT